MKKTTILLSLCLGFLIHSNSYAAAHRSNICPKGYLLKKVPGDFDCKKIGYRAKPKKTKPVDKNPKCPRGQSYQKASPNSKYFVCKNRKLK